VRPSALLSDLDGTLSPIAASPEAAEVLPLCRESLASLPSCLDLVAVLSGRHAGVVRSMVDVARVEYFGVHGLTRWTPNGQEVEPELASYVGRVADVLPRVRRLAREAGVVVEDKGLAVAVHYRQVSIPESTRTRMWGALVRIAGDVGFAAVEGRRVIEIRPPAPYGKGWRLTGLARDRGLRSIVYLGDDTTDIDAFEAIRSWRGDEGRVGVAIAVASDEAPARLLELADGVLPDVPSVGMFLAELARRLAQLSS